MEDPCTSRGLAVGGAVEPEFQLCPLDSVEIKWLQKGSGLVCHEAHDETGDCKHPHSVPVLEVSSQDGWSWWEDDS